LIYFKIDHTLPLHPELLKLSVDQAIKGDLESPFLDNVIANLGLVVSVYDFKSIDGGFMYPGQGASTYTIKFRVHNVSYPPIPIQQEKDSKPFAP
ncbi:RNA polymerase Rpb7-like, N-terminal, partial [Dillenia turbinata]